MNINKLMKQLHPFANSLVHNRLRFGFFKQITRATVAACIAAASLTAARSQANELPLLVVGHTDIGVGFEDNEWDLHVHAEELELEYEPDAVRLAVGPLAFTRVPTNSSFQFLGQPGAPLWVLPEAEQPGVLFLGLGTEEIAMGVFSNDTVRLALKSVTGPGHFALYHMDAFGNPVVSMNSRDGIDDQDMRLLQAGSHAHVNWAFSAPGNYRIGFEASGIATATGETTTSDVAEYLFEVYEAPAIAINSGADGKLTLQWSSLEHYMYHLQSAVSADGPWSDHPGTAEMEGTGNMLSLEVEPEAGEEMRFFRLEIHGEEHHHHDHD